MVKSSELICDALVASGITHVFGIPGGGTTHIWASLYERQDKIKTILCRHEGSAACMVDMYGRLTGKPALLMGQGGFIATSGGFGIVEGFLSNSPMLIITDTSDGNFSQHGTYQSATGEWGSWDIVNIMRGMCKNVTYAVSPEEAITGTQLAVKHAITGKPGPSAMVMRIIASSAEVDPAKMPKIYPISGLVPQSLSVPSEAEIVKTARLLMQAKRPVIIAGGGVHLGKSYRELRELAETLGIPVATSYTGKSVFPEIHPLALGMMGTFGQKLANDVIADADLLLVAGCRLSPSDTLQENPKLISASKQKIIQIDIEPRNIGWNYPVEIGLAGDLKAVMSELLNTLKQLEAGKTVKTEERLKAIEVKKKEMEFFEAPELHSDASPILPQRIVREVEGATDASTIVTLDAGNNRLWMAHFYRTKSAGSLFCPGGLAGMGWGPAAAVTAKLLNPERPVLSVSGDGGFGMMTHVLSTCLQYNLPVAFVVMNNSVLGMVRDGQRKGKYVATEFIKTDFAAIARAYGCKGVRIEKPETLGPAIKEALRATVPTVIDVVTDINESHAKITLS